MTSHAIFWYGFATGVVAIAILSVVGVAVIAVFMGRDID